MGSILWLYQTQGLFIICAPDTDETENSYGGCSLTVGHQKKNNKKTKQKKNKKNKWIKSSFLT